MNEAYWQQLQNIFDAVLALEPTERTAYLQQACGDNDNLKNDVRSLLDAHTNASWEWCDTPVAATLSTEPATPYAKGDRIGHHEIIEQIGAGGMGVVFQAFDTRLQRHVALKFLPTSLHADATLRQRFMTEARTASKLDHANICVIHDINETPQGHMYITMPYYEGETLSARLKRGRLTVTDAVMVAVQVAEGLAAAHALDIVHRDIKPANIMLTGDSGVKILDFGIAKVTDVNLTQTGNSIGTLAYMAPEQMHGLDVDARADIWALGVTLCEMLTGQTTFAGEFTSQVVDAVLDSGTRRARTQDAAIPPGLQLVLATAMQRNRDARYTQMSLMRDALLQFQSGQVADDDATVVVRKGKMAFDWDKRFLDEIIDILLPELGPITSKLVHKQAKQANSVEALMASLSDLLSNEDAKRLFSEKMKLKAAMHTTPPVPNQVNVSNPSTQLELAPVQLAKLETCLLPHVGPIAGMLIRRALATSNDTDTFCHHLVESLSNENEKTSIQQVVKDIIDDK